jgi:hypothetical protein
MALSNWDTLAFDQDGKPTNGTFTNGDISVEIYKNWLSIHGNKGWTDGNKGFIEDVIGHMYHGDIQYKNIHIKAKRGKQYSIMCIVWTVDWKKKGKDRYKMMIGLGCSGYQGHEWVGTKPDTFEALKKFAHQVLSEEIGSEYGNIITFPFLPLRFNQGDAYFANTLGTGLPATETGKSHKPILEQVFEQSNFSTTPITPEERQIMDF